MEPRIEIAKVDIDRDCQGISIARKQIIEVGGQILSSSLERRAFRKVVFNEDQDEATENKNFFNEVDEWTGQKDFIKNKFNF